MPVSSRTSDAVICDRGYDSDALVELLMTTYSIEMIAAHRRGRRASSLKRAPVCRRIRVTSQEPPATTCLIREECGYWKAPHFEPLNSRNGESGVGC
jgi:hypothetical protein